MNGIVKQSIGAVPRKFFILFAAGTERFRKMDFAALKRIARITLCMM